MKERTVLAECRPDIERRARAGQRRDRIAALRFEQPRNVRANQ